MEEEEEEEDEMTITSLSQVPIGPGQLIQDLDADIIGIRVC